MRLFYDISALNGSSDFNKTAERFGYVEGRVCRVNNIWVVSKNAMNVLIYQIGWGKRDFLPVELIDENAAEATSERNGNENGSLRLA